jgi:hypothetical protein
MATLSRPVLDPPEWLLEPLRGIRARRGAQPELVVLESPCHVHLRRGLVTREVKDYLELIARTASFTTFFRFFSFLTPMLGREYPFLGKNGTNSELNGRDRGLARKGNSYPPVMNCNSAFLKSSLKCV